MGPTPLRWAAGATLVAGVAATVAWRASRWRIERPVAAKPVRGPATLRHARRPTANLPPTVRPPLRAYLPLLGWPALFLVLAIAWFGIPPRLESGWLPSQAIALAVAWLLAIWLVFIPRYRQSRKKTSLACGK